MEIKICEGFSFPSKSRYYDPAMSSFYVFHIILLTHSAVSVILRLTYWKQLLIQCDECLKQTNGCGQTIVTILKTKTVRIITR